MPTENSPEPSIPDGDPVRDPDLDPAIELDPIFQSQIDRLHQLTIYGRWVTIGLLWATVGAYSLWELRYPIELICEDFTWSAVKYGLSFQPLPALGLSLCIGVMAATLVWQSRNIIWGIPKQEQERLSRQVCRIRQQGSSHPLWKWVVG
jgi:hypothetical protein